MSVLARRGFEPKVRLQIPRLRLRSGPTARRGRRDDKFLGQWLTLAWVEMDGQNRRCVHPVPGLPTNG
jgi:hypothetical protein